MIKKNILIAVLIIVITGSLYSQNYSDTGSFAERTAGLMEKCLSLLDRRVPGEFKLIEPNGNGYRNNENICVLTENNLIKVSIILMIIS